MPLVIAFTVLCLEVTLGKVPQVKDLQGVPQFGTEVTPNVQGGETTVQGGGTTVSRLAKQTSSLMALLTSHEALQEESTRSSMVWLGDGLGAVSRRVYNRAVKWEFVDLADFLPSKPLDRVGANLETQKLVVLPGFEVTQARKKQVTTIMAWLQAFGRYTAVMAKEFQQSTSGFMSHIAHCPKGLRGVCRACLAVL